MMETLFSSDSIPNGALDATRGSNFARWNNAAFDAAAQIQRTDPTAENWKKICQLLSLEVPAFPLMYGPHLGVVSWRVKKFPATSHSGLFLLISSYRSNLKTWKGLFWRGYTDKSGVSYSCFGKRHPL
jgi:ABC-type oligopeptide transport system substrate-binding subunit